METYFTLFKLILEGKLGHAGQLAAAKEEKASQPVKKGAKHGDKGAKSKGSKASLPSSKAHRPPSSIEQVMFLLYSISWGPRHLRLAYQCANSCIALLCLLSACCNHSAQPAHTRSSKVHAGTRQRRAQVYSILVISFKE